MKKDISVLVVSVAGLFLLLAVGFACLHFFYLPTIVPTVPILNDAQLMEHKEWSTNHVDWYSNEYIVNTQPAEVKAFYIASGADCDYSFRQHFSQDRFMFSCTGDAEPIGVFHVEVGQQVEDKGKEILIFILVGWVKDW